MLSVKATVHTHGKRTVTAFMILIRGPMNGYNVSKNWHTFDGSQKVTHFWGSVNDNVNVKE